MGASKDQLGAHIPFTLGYYVQIGQSQWNYVSLRDWNMLFVQIISFLIMKKLL